MDHVMELLELRAARILLAFVLAIAGIWIIRRTFPWLLARLLRGPLERLYQFDVFEESGRPRVARRVQTISGFVTGATVTAILMALTIYVLTTASVRLETMLAGVGVLGVAIAFGSQTLVRDAISGVFLIVENPYDLGDYVRLNALEGEVVAISLRRTTLRGDDGTEHTVPNGAITATSNFTRTSARHAVTLRVPSEVPFERVVEVVNGVAQRLATAPEVAEQIVDGPTVRGVTAFRTESYDVEVRTMLDRHARRRWPFLINRQLQDAFQEADIRVL